jgi:hypothetical protein
MRQTDAIHRALKRILRARGRTYAAAAGVLGLSESSVKRLFARGELSVARIEALCDWLGIDVADVVVESQAVQPVVTELTPDQERELARDPVLLVTTFLVLNHWSESEILEVFRFTGPELTRNLAHLQRLGLLELLPFGRVKLRTARNFGWRKDGPVQRFFAERVLPEFLATRFDGPGERMRFVGGLLSRDSILRLHASVDALARDEFVEFARDLALPVGTRHGVSLFTGLRPWEFSEFTKLRRGPREQFA